MESIGLLAGGIAHDFNNLLTGIQGFANLIKIENTSPKGSPLDAQLDENLQPILTAAQRAAELVRRLLVFSRQQPIQSAEFDLCECIAEAGAIVSRTLDKKISVVITMHPDPLPIRGDQSLLQSAIMNLCVNSRDAMPRGGTLTIHCGHVASVKGLSNAPEGPEPSGYAEIAVIDTGIGMTPEVKQHLFEPFFTTKPPDKGTGLGLASVYGTIKGHHGLIEVVSEAGRGTTFTLYLPLVPAKTPESMPAPARAPGPRTHEHVMVVDDETMVRSFIRKVLSAEGHQVTVFADPAEALDALRNPHHPFTLAIIDMVMPGMNGMELIKAMRATNRTLPVLLISGYTGTGDTDTFLLDPLVRKLAKPFDSNGLLNAMAKMMPPGNS
jgi:CheY-like chemotaxis protein